MSNYLNKCYIIDYTKKLFLKIYYYLYKFIFLWISNEIPDGFCLYLNRFFISAVEMQIKISVLPTKVDQVRIFV